MTEKKLTRAEHIEAMRYKYNSGRGRYGSQFEAAVDHAIAHGIALAPDPLPEPPEPLRVTVVASGTFWYRHLVNWHTPNVDHGRTHWDHLAVEEIHAEPSYWRDHPNYAEQYEAWKAAQR